MSLNKTSRSREQEQREGENKLKEIIEENFMSWRKIMNFRLKEAIQYQAG